MKYVLLSAEAHGTLNALRLQRSVRYFEKRACEELVSKGFARVDESRLHITHEGDRAPVGVRPAGS